MIWLSTLRNTTWDSVAEQRRSVAEMWLMTADAAHARGDLVAEKCARRSARDYAERGAVAGKAARR